MVVMLEACADCTRRCVIMHEKKKHPHPIVTSFFKVMIGVQFSEVLFLPPKFARTVSALVDEKTHLEDSSGERWEVTLSNLNGSIAFQQGWHAFSSDHGLEVGDFLVFNYIVGSHFVIQIFKKNGCEKVDFPEYCNHKKRNRAIRNSVVKDGSCHTADRGSIDRQGSCVSGSDVEINQSLSDVNHAEKVPINAQNTFNYENHNKRLQVLSRADYIEVPYYMIDRNLGCKEGEVQISLFDLYDFEMQKRIPDAHLNDNASDGGGKSHHEDLLLRSRTEPGLVDKDSVADVVVSGVAPSDPSDVEMIRKSNKSEVIDRAFLSKKCFGANMTSKHPLHTGNNGEGIPKVLNEVVMSQKEFTPLIGDALSVQRKSSQVSGFREFPVAIEMQNFQSGEMMKMVKKEIVEMSAGKESYTIKGVHKQISTLHLNEHNSASKAVKTEILGSTSSHLPDAAIVSCLVESVSALQLPTCWPSSLPKRRIKMDRRVVYLRDQVMRLWPVLYHERYGLKALTRGWQTFSQANNIQPGDECTFVVENGSEGIYRVSVG